MAISKITLSIGGIVLLLLSAVWWQKPDEYLHVVVCDVGQGDAILVFKGKTQLLIDGGPDSKVLGCISRHIPFYDRQIEMVILTHPHADHLSGLIYVLQRYSLKYMFIDPEAEMTPAYKALIDEINRQKISIKSIYTGEKIKSEVGDWQTIWPERAWVASHTQAENNKVLGWKTDGGDLNGYSVVGKLTYGTFDILLPGDADVPVEENELNTGMLRPVEVLKVPHHGSKTGMMNEWLDVIKPKVAVISDGKGNTYGHPHKEALKQLMDRGIKILRTDQVGDVEIVTDGNKWWVK